MFKKIKSAVKNFVQKIKTAIKNVIQKITKTSVSVSSHIRKNWMVYATALVAVFVLILAVQMISETSNLSSDLAKTLAHHKAVDLELIRILQDPEFGDAWDMAVNTIQGIIGKAEAGLV